jgi:hypothetical protein
MFILTHTEKGDCMGAVYCAELAAMELDRLESRLDSLVDMLGKPIQEDVRTLLIRHVENTISASQRLAGTKGLLLARQWNLELDIESPVIEHVENDTLVN